ncbi:MAG TPA: DUF2490 domain-containing protein [Cyclobacteriaceae bacterium]|nr:DUF2490 domain-containing protein [Cyclobacteriaceae bacterium]
MKFLFSPLVIVSFIATGQVNQIWVDFNIQHKINSQWSWIGDAGARYIINQSLSAAFVRGGVVYSPKPNIELLGGLGYFLYNSSAAGITGHELRPWEGLRFNFKISPGIAFTNYSRLEERFILSEGSDDFFLRFRNLTGLTFTVFQASDKSHSIYTPISFEFFEDINKKLFINRHRIYFGIGYAFQKNKLEVHYISQRGRLNTSDDFELTENIYRLRWFRTL